ncbi:hypothetical protein SeMB42_g07879 [Synchytrium endobioticum]|uniref:Uncharacterized protein n=1 Tax=Synchytrium endobioticum TaxID=286115 RepID=A0A507BTN2_9FUNG|nr:hypothetical protein SeMB42_g07879 [Synchytrium endobioticum]
MKVASLYVALGLAAVAQAQICATNLLIDDFRTGQRPTTGPAGNDRIYDLAGGDYGGVGLQGNIAIADGSGTITPDNSAAGLNGTNYFFVKYDPNAAPASTAGITSNVASGAVSMPLVAVVKTALLSALVATMASML